ncbi:hypothetical protein [Flexithrix dorotheae]|nr:hypothetical protein [Flexithrix dorotheae]
MGLEKPETDLYICKIKIAETSGMKMVVSATSEQATIPNFSLYDTN